MTFDKKDTHTLIESWQLKQKYQEKARINTENKRQAKEKVYNQKKIKCWKWDRRFYWTTSCDRKHRREINTESTALWPHNVLQNDSIVQEEIRNKIYVTSPTNITRTLFIRATSGDKRKIDLSYSQTYRYKEEYVKSIADQIKDEWNAHDSFWRNGLRRTATDHISIQYYG